MIFYTEVECFLYDVHSLKEKRSITKRVIAQLKKNFNVTVAELEYLDLWQRMKLGIATISNEKVHGEKMIQEIHREIDSFLELERTITHVEHL